MLQPAAPPGPSSPEFPVAALVGWVCSGEQIDSLNPYPNSLLPFHGLRVSYSTAKCPSTWVPEQGRAVRLQPFLLHLGVGGSAEWDCHIQHNILLACKISLQILEHPEYIPFNTKDLKTISDLIPGCFWCLQQSRKKKDETCSVYF